MNKKASGLELNLLTLLPIIIFVAVFLVVMNVATNIGKSKDFDKKFLSADISLLIDSFQAVPREINFFIKYPLDFGVEIKDNEVNVFEKNPSDGRTFFYNINPDFSVSNNKIFLKTDLKGSFLILSRQGKKLDFITSKHFNLKEDIYCPPSKSQIQKPELLDSDTANILRSYKPDLFTITKQPSEEYDLLLDFINIPDGIRIFVSNDQTLEISCHIFSRLTKEFPGVSIAAVPTDASLLDSQDKRKILEKPKSMVIGFSKTLNERGIVKAVYNGLIDYGLS